MIVRYYFNKIVDLTLQMNLRLIRFDEVRRCQLTRKENIAC